MRKKKILILEMADESTMNGVSRHTEMLCKGINKCLFDVFHIRLLSSTNIVLTKAMLKVDYTEIIIPFPQNAHKILSNQNWADEFSELFVHLLPTHIDSKTILHIHTINLINIACSIKKTYGCKIISHIHCIPWKYFYSGDQAKFNYLYGHLIGEKQEKEKLHRRFMLTDELRIAEESDAIVCLTKSAMQYYSKYLHAAHSKLHFVPNGITDNCRDYATLVKNKRDDSGITQLLYVGRVSSEKGVQFLLEAMNIIRERHDSIQLTIAGQEEKEMTQLIEHKYAKLSITRLGATSYENLCTLYRTCHLGIIPSLFEQCSYSAIEMMMFGLPIIHTDIRELNEMLGRNYSIHTHFNPLDGLTIDVANFAKSIVNLSNDNSLRTQNGIQNRILYLKNYQLPHMIKGITNIYEQL